MSENKVKLMGIINLTPDSFSDGGKFEGLESALRQAAKLISDGADILDLGAESTRPGAIEISAEEELARLIEPLREIRRNFKDIAISVDTYKASVAKKALQNGANIINDVWGGMRSVFFKDENFSTCDIAADFDCKIILMHNRPDFFKPIGNLQSELFSDFDKILENARACGVSYKNIILDGGFGFAKSAEQNLELLKNYGSLRKYGFPLLLGLSKKSTIRKVVGEENAKIATCFFNAYSLAASSSDIIRVHDVKEHKILLESLSAISKSKTWKK